MPRPLRTLLILLLALPAVLVPRGVSLDWCVCGLVESCCVQTRSACCAGETDHEGPLLEAGEDCSCCKRVEVDDFDEVPGGVPIDDGSSDCGFVPPPALVVSAPAGLRLVRATPRAPPAWVTPTGLLPGVRPLLL